MQLTKDIDKYCNCCPAHRLKKTGEFYAVITGITSHATTSLHLCEDCMAELQERVGRIKSE